MINATGFKTRGIVYLIWKGYTDPAPALQRSLASIAHWHPELPVEVVEIPPAADGTPPDLRAKARMYDVTPFEQTLFLDADTTVLGNLDYGFMKAAQHGIALCINANPWQRRYYKVEPPVHPDEIEYSSGVVFFDKTRAGVREVFARWKENHDVPSCSMFIGPEGLRQQAINDQAGFTLAIEQTGFNPFVLPLNWNLYPRWQKHFWGEIKIWHGYDDIPAAVLKWNEEQRQPGAVIRCGGLP